MKRLSLAAMAILVLAFFASAQDTKSQEPKSVDYSFARLSFINGNAYIQRAADLGYEEGQVNMPIAEGDRIGTTDGQAEIYLGKKSYVRLDQNTKIDFLNFPKKDLSLIRLRAWAGNIYLDVNALEKEKAIEVLTSDATFYILDNGLYRIEVKENGETEILVFSGVVEASGEEGSMLVKKEQRLTISNGKFLSKPSSFFASAADAFDRFNESREAKINRQFDRRYLSGELEDYEYELDEYGDWMSMPEFGYVWVPRGMAYDWRPYSYGRWTWLPMAGWCWIPYEPWGWSTFHYGRWHWGMGMGWYWIPMHVWGPAWVNWWWGYDYYAWAPMSYWGYPGIIIDNFYYGRGWRNYDEYPYNSRALTVIHKNQLQTPDVRKAALSPDVIKSVGKIKLTERALSEKPVINRKISIEQMEGGKKMILRKSGEGGDVKPADRPDRTAAKGREIERPKSGEQKETEGQKKIDPKTTDSKTGEQVKKGETPPPDKTAATGERKIRKKIGDEGEGGGTDSNFRSYPSRSENIGFPSSREIGRESSSQGSRISKPASVMDKFYRFFSGEKGLSSSPSSSPSRGSTSRGSISRSMPRGSSAPSSSRGSAGGSAGSRSGSGTIRKK
ncbi:MAG: FecR domain-containing protein [Candidatus Aminicenantes bacterium]|nr:FecR domain-containing protein [Candidatus Aminicenantes bacterium]